MTLLRINDQTIDDVVRYLRRNPREEKPFEPASISLGAALELAFCTDKASAHPALQRWQKRNQFLKQTVEITCGAAVKPPSNLYAPRKVEFFPIRKKADVTNDLWNRFLERCSASLRNAGFGKLSQAIAGALDEMAGNITQHSTFRHPTQPINGLAAYTVAEKTMSFAVGDSGIGALASLRFNPKWSSLASSREAVRAIALEHASRRIGQGEGQGYRALFNALASFNGSIRLRSGTGIFRMSGALDHCAATGANGPDIPGLQLAVECSLK